MNNNTHVPQMQDHRARLCARIREVLADDDPDSPILSDDAIVTVAYRLLFVMLERGWDPMEQDSWDRAARVLRQQRVALGGAA